MSVNTEILKKQNKDRLEQIFKEGCKLQKAMTLGVELEHFLVRKQTKKAITYEEENGVRDILEKLLKIYPHAIGVYESGKDIKEKDRHMLFGITTDEFSLSLEPASQLEISISPRESIEEIEKIYRSFRRNLDIVLDECNAECITTGYHPIQKAEDLALIPKERYRVMDAYFAKLGIGGREMMRATASTQISIDYVSVDDFRKKFQAAYVLTPMFKYLTDNTLVYEGKEEKPCLRRTQIWKCVDKARTGIVPGALTGKFTFSDYADYLWNMPLVYCPENLLPDSYKNDWYILEADKQNTISAVEDLTAAQIWKDAVISEDAAWHIMSMAFPDVRLKNYVEIRGVDSMSIEKALGYIALVKGLLYQQSVLDEIDSEIQLQNINAKGVQEAEKSLIRDGKKAVVYGKDINVLCEKMIQRASDFLPKQEQKYLVSMR